MGAWNKDKKLDALMEIVTQDHWPQAFYEEDSSPSGVIRCTCGDAGYYPDHLRQMVDNEGFIQDDPGVR